MSTNERIERFLQPAEAIHVVSRAGSGTLLSPEILALGRQRIEAGEDPDEVITELAMIELEILEDLRGEEPPRTLEFNPDQPRDEQGQWTSSGNSESDAKVDQTVREARISRVERRSNDVADYMGFDSKRIHIVDKEPRSFNVGNLNFNEAGHYNPSTRQIEINARITNDDRMSVTQGLVTHEISHAIFHEVKDAIELEHNEIRNLDDDAFGVLFKRNGYPRPEKLDEVRERWPASSLFAETWGDGYLGDADQREAMVKENGHSAYAKAYWQKEELDKSGGYERALNETLAEVNRYLLIKESWNEIVTPKPKSPWVKLAKGIREVRDKISRRKST